MASSNEVQSARPTYPRILLVDESESARRILKSILVKAGYHTVETNDARDAVAQVSAEHFDMVITDLEMSPLDGLTLIAAMLHLPEDRPTPKVILCSQNVPPTVTENLRRLGIPTVAKPVDAAHLILTVQATLARSPSDQAKAALAGQPRDYE